MILFIYNIIVSFLLFIFFINFFINSILFKDISDYKLPPEIKKENPLISILVPARNEEKNIEKCLLSLIKQDYNNTEILVLNDNSTDKTARITGNISKIYKNVKLINGKPLPEGWTGKNYACYQLFKKSKGKYLFFTDADTIHSKESVTSAISCLMQEKLDILSACPEQIMKTFHERMVINLTNFQILIPPLLFIRKSKIPVFGSGIGSLMVVKRNTYRNLGGHKGIKNSCVEDTTISKLFIKMGYKFMIFNGRRTYSTRLYNSFKEIYDGFCRIFLGNFKSRFTISLIILVMFVFFLLPFILLALLPLIEFQTYTLFYSNLLMILFQILVILLTRAMAAIKINGNIIDIFLHPISIFYMIFMNSKLLFQKKGKPQISWKGRLYRYSSNLANGLLK
ncbi:MAG TPA: glycosyltransferase [Candidatus Hydromicrobium sp.]